MIVILIADTINDMAEKEWKEFQKRTEDWSGDDIVGLFSDLYTTYMGRMIDATHFKKVSSNYNTNVNLHFINQSFVLD